MRERPVVTIDGPSGAGKSTVAKRLAEDLGFTYLDTGAMYRGVAYAYAIHNDGKPLSEFLEGLDILFRFKGETQVFLGGQDISQAIRKPEISQLASSLSRKREVREFLTGIQREMGKRGGIIMEGRDTGSVVFPDAEVKFFLDANIEERARRRYDELEGRGISPEELVNVKEEMEERDRNDSNREIAPLVRPEGSHYIDTTGINIEEVVERLKGYILRGI